MRHRCDVARTSALSPCSLRRCWEAAPAALGRPRAVACTVTYGGEARRLEFPATSDPYAASALDVAGRFRFKASVSPRAAQRSVDQRLRLPAAEGGNVLLQEGKYTPPFSPAGGALWLYRATARLLGDRARARILVRAFAMSTLDGWRALTLVTRLALFGCDAGVSWASQ